ncbi:MAG TPA: DUF2092 domain-containing protein [Oligoflexus sp.]|uniref:DUF2092 domain-containing protein n=1 Tax=Oligoflexus sp. TaxID=1971216 RepID=UPI002D7E20F9|nr:DUF2092 domain-containing protein [Oligoflexus sp.]HET9237939.1 DUF2092 domain-containing protein [Oligoflexus sp.]
MLKSAIASGLLLILSTQGYADESSEKALALLKKTTNTLQSAKTLSVRAVATIDEVEPTEDFKLQRTFSLEVKFERPGKLYAQKTGDENQVAYFDGKTFTVIDPIGKRYGQMALEGTVDDLLMKLDELNVQAPLIDLLLSNLTEVAQKSVLKAKYIGVSRVAARNCEHIAFRTAVADWQLWVAQDAQGSICKSVITTRSVAQAPQYQVTFGQWTYNTSIEENSFTSKIPAGAQQVPLTPGTFRLAL